MFDRSLPQQEAEQPQGWPEEAKRFLETFYGDAQTVEERVKLLENKLGGQHNMYATQMTQQIPDAPEGKELYGKSISVPLEVRQAALEHELLEQEELITPDYL